ncbi:MAG TPA: carboxypeptidase-like regulatory domain-containing protein [Bacteroidales bacterium]|nr:carboxypeptidase-like regulatory domain-containing protein [Bacteroidales bacterium]
MAKLFHTSFLFLFFVGFSVIDCQAQFADEVPFYVKGQLVNSRTNEKIVFANVVNPKTMVGAISDSAGIFIILAKPGDVLQISSLGYHPRLFTVNDSLKHQFIFPRIKMVEKIYEIKNVDIRFFGTYEQFKYRILHTKTEDPLAGLNKKLRKTIDSIAKLPTSDLPTFSLGSPVSALYMAFSKEGKQLRKLEKAIEVAPSRKIIESKFNRQVLENVSGLTGEELNEFALFCKLSDDFIIKATEYELYEKIMEYFERFKKRDKDTTRTK